jgi:hypothetical protein
LCFSAAPDIFRGGDKHTNQTPHIQRRAIVPTFKNTSDEVFQDGDLVVRPGESFSTEDEARIDQMRYQYAWQFAEGKGKATDEAELKANPQPVRELRTGGHVETDEEGKQQKVGE